MPHRRLGRSWPQSVLAMGHRTRSQAASWRVALWRMLSPIGGMGCFAVRQKATLGPADEPRHEKVDRRIDHPGGEKVLRRRHSTCNAPSPVGRLSLHDPDRLSIFKAVLASLTTVPSLVTLFALNRADLNRASFARSSRRQRPLHCRALFERPRVRCIGTLRCNRCSSLLEVNGHRKQSANVASVAT